MPKPKPQPKPTHPSSPVRTAHLTVHSCGTQCSREQSLKSSLLYSTQSSLLQCCLLDRTRDINWNASQLITEKPTWWWSSLAVPEAVQQPAVSDARWCPSRPSRGPPPSCGACRQCVVRATTAWHGQLCHRAQSEDHAPCTVYLPSVCPSRDP